MDRVPEVNTSKHIEKIRHDWPTELEPGLIPTTNAMGIMTREPAPVALKFAEHASHAQYPVLEIGAAYGNASYPALEAGGTVIACDLAEDELARLRAPVPREMQKRLITIPARFPDQLHFTAGSLSAILAAQVLHFFDGPAVKSALAAAFRWLQSGDGKLYLVVMTPQLSYYIKLLPEFRRRKEAGDPWPGTFDPRLAATPEWRNHLPPLVNLFDADILRRAVGDAGFIIEHLEPFCYRDFPQKHRTNGEEFLGLIARKP
jgi:SAM-dependent methyltransferase